MFLIQAQSVEPEILAVGPDLVKKGPALSFVSIGVGIQRYNPLKR
jgi:hypothetical protein